MGSVIGFSAFQRFAKLGPLALPLVGLLVGLSTVQGLSAFWRLAKQCKDVAL